MFLRPDDGAHLPGNFPGKQGLPGQKENN